MARVGEEFPVACPGCGGDIRLIADGRQEPAYFEPEVRKREKARMPTARDKSGFKVGSSRRDKSGLERGYEAPRHLHDRAASSPIGSGCCSS